MSRLGRAMLMLSIAVVMTSVPVPTGASDDAPGEALSIGTLGSEELQSLPYVCECEFFRGPITGATTVFATREQRKLGLAKIDGRPVRLRREGGEALSGCRPRSRYRERWVDGSTSLVLDLHATGPGAESCWYEGTMSVTVGRRRGVASVSGACGW